MYKSARNKSGLTIEQAAELIPVGRRTLSTYESKGSPPPDVVLQMSKVYGDPWLTQKHCKYHCAIGEAYSYDILNNINLDIPSVLLKLSTKMVQAEQALPKLMSIVINKNSREDFTEKEWQEFNDCLDLYLDIEHNVEILKISMGKWCDTAELVQRHNQKCRDKGYIKKENNRSVATVSAIG